MSEPNTAALDRSEPDDGIRYTPGRIRYRVPVPDAPITPAPAHSPDDWEDIDHADAVPGEYVRSIYTYDGLTVTVEGYAVTRSTFAVKGDPLFVPFSARPTARYQRLTRKDHGHG